VRWIRLTVKKCGRAKEESRFYASGNGSNDRIIYDNGPVRVPRSGKSPAMILIFAHGGGRHNLAMRKTYGSSAMDQRNLPLLSAMKMIGVFVAVTIACALLILVIG
jgi:hypothetical protein